LHHQRLLTLSVLASPQVLPSQRPSSLAIFQVTLEPFHLEMMMMMMIMTVMMMVVIMMTIFVITVNMVPVILLIEVSLTIDCR
jgi:hypothetical protein